MRHLQSARSREAAGGVENARRTRRAGRSRRRRPSGRRRQQDAMSSAAPRGVGVRRAHAGSDGPVLSIGASAARRAGACNQQVQPGREQPWRGEPLLARWRDGAGVVVVDPRRSVSVAAAGTHLANVPGRPRGRNVALWRVCVIAATGTTVAATAAPVYVGPGIAASTMAVSTNCSKRTISPPRTTKWWATRTLMSRPVALLVAV